MRFVKPLLKVALRSTINTKFISQVSWRKIRSILDFIVIVNNTVTSCRLQESQIQIVRSGLCLVTYLNHCSRCWQLLPTFCDDVTTIESNRQVRVNVGATLVAILHIIKWSGISPSFARLWLAETAFTRVYLRVNWPLTAFSGLFGVSIFS